MAQELTPDEKAFIETTGPLMGEEKPYMIHCTCGARVRPAGWFLHLQHGDRSKVHRAPWEAQQEAR